MILVGLAQLAMARNELGEAADYASQARKFVDKGEMRHFYPLVALTEGQLDAAQGELGPALERFKVAEEQAVEMGMRPLVWQARAAAARVLSQTGREDEAEQKREQALAIINEIADLFEDEELRSQHLASATKGLK